AVDLEDAPDLIVKELGIGQEPLVDGLDVAPAPLADALDHAADPALLLGSRDDAGADGRTHEPPELVGLALKRADQRLDVGLAARRQHVADDIELRRLRGRPAPARDVARCRS